MGNIGLAGQAMATGPAPTQGVVTQRVHPNRPAASLSIPALHDPHFCRLTVTSVYCAFLALSHPILWTRYEQQCSFVCADVASCKP